MGYSVGVANIYNQLKIKEVTLHGVDGPHLICWNDSRAKPEASLRKILPEDCRQHRLLFLACRPVLHNTTSPALELQESVYLKLILFYYLLKIRVENVKCPSWRHEGRQDKERLKGDMNFLAALKQKTQFFAPKASSYGSIVSPTFVPAFLE